MNHKTRAFLFTLAAVLVFAAPSAFAANYVGGNDVIVPPGANTISIMVASDFDLRGLGFGYELQVGTATSATVTGLTINTADLGNRRTLTANSGYVFMAGGLGESDLAANPAGAALIDIDVDVQGLTGNTAYLVIGGVAPWPDNPIFVDTDPGAGRTLIDPVTIAINLQAGVVVTFEGICPVGGATVEGGSVAAQVTLEVNDGEFVSLSYTGAEKDGSPATPANEPEVTGFGLVEAPDAQTLVFYWEPAAGEAGDWTFCFHGENNLGDTDDKCFTVTIAAPDADAAIWAPDHIEYTDGGGAFPYTFVMNYTTGADSTFGIVGPFVLKSLTGGAFFATALVDTDVIYPSAFDVFESKSTNSYGNDAATPDSILSGLIDFGGPALNPGTYGVNYNATLLDVEGIMAFDQATPPGFPPANLLSFNTTFSYDNFDGTNDGVVYPSYAPGCYAVTIVRNICPDYVGCPVSTFGPVIFGDVVSIPGFTYNDPDDSPGPYTFSVVSAEKDGDPGAVPTNAPVFVGDEFQWQTSNADQNDVGIWTFTVTVDDGAGCAGGVTCAFTVEVISQAPFYFCIGSAEAYSNADVTVCITGLNNAPVPVAGGFDLVVDYDASMLTLKEVQPGQALLDEEWEYFTYRIVSTNPAKIRLIAIADMNNSNIHPTGNNPQGDIACLTFHTTNDRNLACQKAFIRFEWIDCGDNAVSSASGDTLFIVGGVEGDVIYDDLSGTDFYLVEPDPFGWNATVTTDPVCLGTQKQQIVPFISFCNGWIKIMCPGDIDDRGDLNLNGLAYEIADAVLYSNYFIFGSGVFDPALYEAQIAASDINADGVVLTVADLVYLIRVITGDAEPIAENIIPKVAAVGTLDVVSAQQGASVTVSTQSEHNLGAALFVFNYDNVEIADVKVAGRASEMDVAYNATGSELRVLVYNIEDRAQIAAGSGEILTVAGVGAGSIELVSVEAATFMGGALEATVSSKVVPTAFALHQNYPNPFNPSTSMALDLPKASDYKLTVYNIAGQVVKTFAGHGEAGTVTITWDGTNNQGASVASGVYFYMVDVEGAYRATHKMVLMK